MGDLRQRAYDSLPWWAQNVAATIEGARIRRDRYGHRFSEMVEEFAGSEWHDQERLARVQLDRLRRVCRVAGRYVPYYQDTFAQAGFDFESAFSIEEFTSSVPILTKAEVQETPHRFVNPTVPYTEIREAKTSGTTGAGLQLLHHRDHVSAQWAIWWRHKRRFGLKLHDRYAGFSGRPVIPPHRQRLPVWRHNLALNQTFFSVFHLSDRTMPAILDKLDRGNYDYITGYPSALHIVATWMKENDRQLMNPPRWVVTGAESLLGHQRDLIEERFRRPVIDQYGLSEGVANISQAECWRYHVDEEFSFVEFVGDGGFRKIVGTHFFNTAMPLIRYDTGDLASGVATESCSCGRVSRTVDSLDGRIEAVLSTPDGRKVGRLDFVFKDMIGIREAQIVQKALDRIEVLIVPGPHFQLASRSIIESRIKAYLGETVQVDVKQISQIPRSSMGKLRAVIAADMVQR